MRCFRLTVSTLAGPGTFSAALVTKALLKEYSGRRVMLVGESMGDHRRRHLGTLSLRQDR
jgi:hypothetical protein